MTEKRFNGGFIKDLKAGGFIKDLKAGKFKNPPLKHEMDDIELRFTFDALICRLKRGQIVKEFGKLQLQREIIKLFKTCFRLKRTIGLRDVYDRNQLDKSIQYLITNSFYCW